MFIELLVTSLTVETFIEDITNITNVCFEQFIDFLDLFCKPFFGFTARVTSPRALTGFYVVFYICNQQVVSTLPTYVHEWAEKPL
jgi:hypothetical protein